LQCRVDWYKFTDVSEICTASIIRAKSDAACGNGRHMRNFMEFIIIKSLRGGPEDILVSFDVVSHFTTVPLGEALRLLGRHFGDDILCLFRHVLTSYFFRFDGQFYEQADGVAVGSSVSPVIASFLM
jgi:hypothetical protein